MSPASIRRLQLALLWAALLGLVLLWPVGLWIDPDRLQNPAELAQLVAAVPAPVLVVATLALAPRSPRRASMLFLASTGMLLYGAINAAVYYRFAGADRLERLGFPVVMALGAVLLVTVGVLTWRSGPDSGGGSGVSDQP